KLATAEDLIASMDQAGVQVSIALNIGWASHQLCVETNDYLLEATARYPHRLVAFCALQPRAGEAALEEMERCARAGARGLGELRPDDQGFQLSDEVLLRPMIDKAIKLNLTLLFHASEPVGHLYPGKGKVTPDQLWAFITLFPSLPVIFAHWGGGLPFYALMPEVGRALDRVYFDTAATSFLYRPQVFHQAIEAVGAGKILFGSDYPLIEQGRALSLIQALDLPEAEKSLITGDNAARLLNILAERR
ncbi:MAG: amidohydrolase family protein, partial [Chloroflexota bacterium]|nr:amidohydrolase family protein [Chloroflexota bacterium]